MIGAGGSDWKHYVRRKPHVVKRRIRKGIPDCLRGLVWQLISGSRDLLLMNPGVYEVSLFYFIICLLFSLPGGWTIFHFLYKALLNLYVYEHVVQLLLEQYKLPLI